MNISSLSRCEVTSSGNNSRDVSWTCNGNSVLSISISASGANVCNVSLKDDDLSLSSSVSEGYSVSKGTGSFGLANISSNTFSYYIGASQSSSIGSINIPIHVGTPTSNQYKLGKFMITISNSGNGGGGGLLPGNPDLPLIPQ